MSETIKTCKCGNKFTTEVEGEVIYESLTAGVYYSGPPVCDTCRDALYEEAITEYELEQLNEDNK